MTQNH
jgi:hypothetical protein